MTFICSSVQYKEKIWKIRKFVLAYINTRPKNELELDDFSLKLEAWPMEEHY